MNRKRENCCNPSGKKKSKTNSHSNNNWLDLPREIMVLIFQKLGLVRMLMNAQLVCSHWRNIAKEPILFRHILLQGESCPDDDDVPTVEVLKFALFAVDKCCGQLVRFSCDVMLPFHKHHLHHIADSCTSSMKSLRLGYCPNVEPLELAQVIKKIPSLEELHLHDFEFPKCSIVEIGRSCPKLKYLQLRTVPGASDPPSDEEAFAIAESMPSLRRLRLLQNGNGLTNTGLQAIINGCPQLEYVFLSRCPNIDLEGALFKKRHSRIQNIRIDPVNDEREFRIDTGAQSQVPDFGFDFSNDQYPEIYVEHDIYSSQYSP